MVHQNSDKIQWVLEENQIKTSDVGNSLQVLKQRFSLKKGNLCLGEMMDVFFSLKFNDNKKVLLRERKRHTTRRVASDPYAGDGGGYPIQSWWGVPHPVMVGGYPIQS